MKRAVEKRRIGDLGIERGAPSPPSPRAWFATCGITPDGRLVAVSDRAMALRIVAVSVHEQFSCDPQDRLRLLGEIQTELVRQVEDATPVLLVFPGGYFGYDAHASAWLRLQYTTYRRVMRGLQSAVAQLPIGSAIAVGFDSWSGRSTLVQQVCVAQRWPGGIIVTPLARGQVDLASRVFDLGGVKAAFFVCGEFTGSRTDAKYAFFLDAAGGKRFLVDPAAQLPSCRLLVDVAHRRVSGSVSGSCSPRMLHRLQMERFSKQGAAVLAHHHGGVRIGARSHFKHQSHWIVGRGGVWLSEDDVKAFL